MEQTITQTINHHAPVGPMSPSSGPLNGQLNAQSDFYTRFEPDPECPLCNNDHARHHISFGVIRPSDRFPDILWPENTLGDLPLILIVHSNITDRLFGELRSLNHEDGMHYHADGTDYVCFSDASAYQMVIDAILKINPA